QATRLRVRQEGESERVGGTASLRIDVAVVAATHKDLIEAGSEGTLRRDLYDRRNVIPAELPPLRARRDDIAELAEHFLAQAARRNDRPGVRFDADALPALAAHSFPGNVREPKDLVERLVILGPYELIRATY